MKKFYQTQEFRELQEKWRRKLKQSGFDDLENGDFFRAHDIRTAAWANQNDIRDFFIALDHLMTHYPEMPPFERKVMELYSRGIYVKTIVQKTRKSDKTVRNVIKRYRDLLRAIGRLHLPTDFPYLLNPQSDADSEAPNADERAPRASNKAA